MAQKLKPWYRIFGRRQYEVNTDPQRRCYYGVHFCSEMVWGPWHYLGACFTEEEANESVIVWKRANKSPQFQYKWELQREEESIQETQCRVNSCEPVVT